MEPASVPAAAERGTLEDPEVLQNVPGHVIPILQREYDDFKTEAGKFLQGDMPEDEFIKFRLRQGVYGQRQPDVQMIRVKLPFGGITPEQMEAFADVVESTCRWARATSLRARTSRCTTSRCRKSSRRSASSARPGCPAARAAATRSETSPAIRGQAWPRMSCSI